MNESVRYDRCQQIQLGVLAESPEGSVEIVSNGGGGESDSPQGTGNILCTHDGVLLKKANAEHISDMNTSGSLSLVEYTRPRRRLYLEWQPNDSIMIAKDSQDQDDWAVVDRISGRTRTTSECNAFNMKPADGATNGNAVPGRARIMRVLLDDLAAVEVRDRGLTIRFLRKSDDSLHCEFFFQHGNADLFVCSMRQQDFIESSETSNSGGQKYAILNTENQMLKKTFAELDIGEIKERQLPRESWLSNKLVVFLGSTIPDFVQPSFQRSPKSRPNTLIHGERQTSPDNFIKLSGSTNSACSSNSQSRGESADKSPADSELENLNAQDEKIVNNLPARQSVTRGQPLSENQWLEFQTPDGRISDSVRIKEIIFRGGIVHSLRAEVWKYLLNYYQWSDTEMERRERRNQKFMEYYKMKAQWLAMTQYQEANFSGYRDRKCQIEKDVKRTDRTQLFFAGEDNPNLALLQGILMTYVMYNFDLGYVQGMSDLLAPILEIQVNEVDAFWCFVGFMDMVFTNFDIDQTGMKTQFAQLRRLLEVANAPLFHYMLSHDSDNMYFCFRWLLVWYKRELDNDDVLKLWECLWTRLPCANFHLLFSVAILDKETNVIIDRKYEFTEILKHVNELTGTIDLQRTLETAEAIYLQLKSSEALPNDIRHIIGEPMLPAAAGEEAAAGEHEETTYSDDGFDELRELTPEEKRRNQELLEEALERSMFLNYV